MRRNRQRMAWNQDSPPHREGFRDWPARRPFESKPRHVRPSSMCHVTQLRRWLNHQRLEKGGMPRRFRRRCGRAHMARRA